jgi:ribosome-binding protein aMBF1 (putative translation factor)
MKITCDHPTSSYGIPVILDDAGNVIDYAPGVKAVRGRLGLTAEQLAEHCGYSVRSVNSWEQGRSPVTASALNVMASLLKKERRHHA